MHVMQVCCEHWKCDHSHKQMSGQAETDNTPVGLCLTSEATSHDSSEDVALGVVVCGDLASLTVAQLRSLICSQIQTLPTSFIFVTEQGWPIQNNQESCLNVRKILTTKGTIRIKRHHERSRIGVKFSHGSSLGFVFCELLDTLNVLRDSINQQLGRVKGSSSLSYQFVDRNGWPILPDQEYDLSVLDILQQGSVSICSEVFIKSSKQLVSSRDETHHEPRMTKQLTFTSGKDELLKHDKTEELKVGRKQILISYVRAEAAQHALDLKTELTQLGFSIFLDVDEIKSGTDWQDALNYAVSNCEIFIPLVTPRYGQTQWTNREVKLADVLNKFILPISFVERWPPRCLGIQFATTQFINWKTQEEMDAEMKLKGYSYEQCQDIRIWDREVVIRVCSAIAEQVESYSARPHDASQLCDFATTLPCKPSMRRTSTRLTEGFTNEHLPGSMASVVICLHPDERHFGQELKKMFKENRYRAWCTTDLIEKNVPLSDQVENFAEKCLHFQEEVDRASVVVFVLSKAFAKCRMTKQQIFYCEQRKPVIAVTCEDFHMPGWMSMLIGSCVLQNVNQEGFMNSVLARVRQYIDCKLAHSLQIVAEAKTCCATKLLRKTLPKENCVYIVGGTTFHNQKSKDICISIGRNLAELKGVSLVTGGFYGVEDVIATSFHSRRLELGEEPSLWHVLPVKDSLDFSRKCRQNEDKTFQAVPYGKTVFSGDSVHERETIVSRVIDICILIEGGPGAAHQAEQFIWNDHSVIPVNSTGGAAGGMFNVPEKMNDIPPGVAAEDWMVLSNTEASPGEVGRAVASIVTSLQERIEMLNKSSLSSPLNLSQASTISPTDLFKRDSFEMSRKRKSESQSPQSKRPKLNPCRTYILHNK